jgi:hypothetical protein
LYGYGVIFKRISEIFYTAAIILNLILVFARQHEAGVFYARCWRMDLRVELPIIVIWSDCLRRHQRQDPLPAQLSPPSAELSFAVQAEPNQPLNGEGLLAERNYVILSFLDWNLFFSVANSSFYRAEG